MLGALLVLLAVVGSSTPQEELHCWTGWQIWEIDANNVTLTKCQRQHGCCFMVASLNGNQFGCYDSVDCPASGVAQCGPDPALGIQDIHFCYCPSYRDPKCLPYLGEKSR